MRVGSFFQKRGDLYRFRARLPAALVAVFHRKEVVVPLAARDRRTLNKSKKEPPVVRRAAFLTRGQRPLIARISSIETVATPTFLTT